MCHLVIRKDNGTCLQHDVKEIPTCFERNTQNLSNIKHCHSAFIDEAANKTMADDIKKEDMATINEVVKLFKNLFQILRQNQTDINN